MSMQREIPSERHLVAEHSLLAKMLRQAVLDYLGSSAVCAEDSESAEIWLFNDIDQEPFSFYHVCQELSLDKGYLRRMILEFKSQNKLPKGW